MGSIFNHSNGLFGSHNSHFTHHDHGCNSGNHHNNSNNQERDSQSPFSLFHDFNTHPSIFRPSAHATSPRFQPRFDVRENHVAFELHGELPGANRSNIHIEFTDPSTILIRGHIDHFDNADNTVDAGSIATITEPGEDAGPKEHVGGTPSSTVWAMVQNKTEADANDHGFEAVDTPQSSVTAKSHIASQPTTPKKAAVKYWLTERNIGKFSRTFTFPTRVEPADVTAKLTDGILAVVIPKSKKHETCRIHVS